MNKYFILAKTDSFTHILYECMTYREVEDILYKWKQLFPTQQFIVCVNQDYLVKSRCL